MTQTSDKLMSKLIQLSEWSIDNEVPKHEKLKLIPRIHELTSSIKSEIPNMSKAERVDIVIQLIVLESIVKLEIKKAKKEYEDTEKLK